MMTPPIGTFKSFGLYTAVVLIDPVKVTDVIPEVSLNV